MAAVHGKVTAFVGLTKEKFDGTSNSLDGNREINRRLIDRLIMMTRLSRTASARQLLLQGYGCISSVCKAMAVSQAFMFHFKCYSILHFAVCQLLCWAFLSS